MKEEIMCPVKNKTVNISNGGISAGALEDKGSVPFVKGRYVCSDNDCWCDYDKCPMNKMD